MADKKKLGFGGQWVDGTPVGRHVDSDGDEVLIDVAFLEAVAVNFENTKHLHQPPAVIGHPKSNAPAYGYISALRVNEGRLERQFSEVNPEFEEIVKSGAYKKRSDAFYLDPKTAPGGLVPALRHVGFLGAQPPAIKGIADIQFSEEGKTVDVEVDTAINFSEGEDMDQQQLEKTIGERIAAFFKETFGGKDDKPATAEFSEADRKKLADDIAKSLEVKFSEELKARDTKIEELTKQVESGVGSSRRGEVIAFFEEMKAKGILPPALKDRVVNLMDALATLPDKKVAVIEFAEENGKEVEKKTEHTLLREFQEFVKALPPYIKFGEAFGGLKANGDGSDIVNPERMKRMQQAAGLPGETKKD